MDLFVWKWSPLWSGTQYKLQKLIGLSRSERVSL